MPKRTIQAQMTRTATNRGSLLSGPKGLIKRPSSAVSSPKAPSPSSNDAAPDKKKRKFSQNVLAERAIAKAQNNKNAPKLLFPKNPMGRRVRHMSRELLQRWTKDILQEPDIVIEEFDNAPVGGRADGAVILPPKHMAWKAEAIEAVHTIAEAFLEHVFQNAQHNAVHARRRTLMLRDFRLALFQANPEMFPPPSHLNIKSPRVKNFPEGVTSDLS